MKHKWIYRGIGYEKYKSIRIYYDVYYCQRTCELTLHKLSSFTLLQGTDVFPITLAECKKLNDER